MQQTPSPGQELTFFEYLRWMMIVGTQFEFSNPYLAKIAYRAVFDDVPLPDDTLQLIRNGTLDFFQQQIQQAIQNGTIKPDIEPSIAAFVCNTVFTNLGQYIMEQNNILPKELLDQGAQAFQNTNAQNAMNQVIDILEHGLSAK